ncbi:hypothetical protein DYU05_04080 [Mucilaginibacter terrenus]|uniref:XRE family transcriptional regulator n=2 Tax=Mucilaginibacter terrenus TaxID=2482727 RepID=A0A3E2NUV9_9SPHI|nr:hypothetical protein DYU05_04080 [Mucilaginibacter terrenus]
MILKDAVDRVLSDQKRSLSWLANEMNRTVDGLRLALVNGSIKYNDLVRLVEVLDVPVAILFPKRLNEETSNGTSFSETAIAYKLQMEVLKENIDILKNTIKDKEKIIELLSKH